MGNDENPRLEYTQLMENYRSYFGLVARGVTIYLLMIGACLSLPYTLELEDPSRLVVFAEMCRTFAVLVTIGGVAGFLVGSATFVSIHRRLKALSTILGMGEPKTWLLPFVVWLVAAVAVYLLFMLSEYA